MYLKSWMIGVASLASICLVACGDTNNDEARVRVFHASPDAPNVDVLVDQGRVLEDVPYTEASDFLPVPAGTRHIAVNITGTDTTVIDARLDLEDDVDYLVVAAGKAASIAPIVATCDRTVPPEGSARVRVLHSAASAPAVDIYVTAPNQGIDDAQPALSAAPFRAISDYLTIPGGTYDVRVTVAGTKTVAIEALNLAIPAGTVTTVAALDAKGGGSPFSLRLLSER
jgi:hypothetical protein